MPDEIKNPFDFGTGSIDKDQWLRDIDEGQELFIGSYGPSLNKHRTALLRQAFADLRRRISNGDMLSRTADGLYQFGSALNRDDKHMLEAYERALGFMGELARRLIKAPTKEPEKKKFEATTLEDVYKKSLFPGKFNEKAYWDRDESKRKQSLIDFLEGYTKEGALDSYQDFGSFESSEKLRARLNSAIDALKSGQEMDYNLGRLGFQGSWITKPVEETTETKTELELLQEALLQNETKRLNLLIKRALSWEEYRGNPINWNFETRPYDYQGMFNFNVKEGTIKVPGNFGAFNFGVQGARDRQKALYNAFDEYNIQKLTNFFSNLGVNYNQVAKDKTALLGAMLGLLQSSIKIGDLTINPYSSLLSKYFTPMSNGAYYINGSANKEKGRYAFYAPLLIGNYSPGIHEVSYLDLPDEVVKLALEIPSQKEGGKILKMQGGGGLNALLSDELWDMLLNNNKVEDKTSNPPSEKSKLKEIRAADIAAISADIGSIISSFVPGYGTAASAVLGVGSTLSNFISDVSDNDTSLGDALWNGAKGLGADAIGLIPGFGAGAKGWKIATRLAKYGTGLMASLSTIDSIKNSPGIMNSFKKLISLKVNDMDLLDWRNIQNGLSILSTAGRLGHGVAVHQGYKGQLNVKNPKKSLNTPEATTRTEKAKAKLNEFKNKFKGNGDEYDYGGPNNLPWYHDANIYLWGANRNGFNLGIKNPYKIDMTNHMIAHGPKKINTPLSQLLYNSPSKTVVKSAEINTGLDIKAPQYRNRNIESVNKGVKKAVYKKQLGGILKTLRNGGIIKALLGLSFPDLKPSLNFSSSYYVDWVNKNWNNPADIQASLKGYQLAGSSDRVPNGLTVKGGPNHKYDFVTKDDVGNTVYKLDFMSAYKEQLDYYDKDLGTHIFGDVLSYYKDEKKNNPDLTIESFITQYNDNVDKLRSPEWVGKKLEGTANTTTGFRTFNRLFNSMYRSYSPYSEALEDRLGESTWRRVPNTFNGDNDRKDLRTGLLEENNLKSKVIIDNDGKLKLVDQAQLTVDGSKEKEKDVVDTSGSRVDPMGVTTKNPFDPTLLSVAAKTLIGLRGNANIYGNLLREMPQAPLRDPIDRKLAILGWQDQIKQGQNQLADLRNILLRLQGSDQLTNFATALEAERVGRGIMDDKYIKDAGRQFETALKSWNIDNEDILYNIKVGDDNRKSIADRARMMAQIRAAWRSGDNNILMGALADTTNWWLKRYQREQDLLDKAKELALGTPEEKAQSDLYENDTKYRDLMDKYLRGDTLTDEEKAYVKSAQAKALRSIRGTYALSYYNSFHNPLYGGNFYYGKIPVGKDGTKLEVEKLKARGKDNDRFVSMFKDLRKHSYRRRRR